MAWKFHRIYLLLWKLVLLSPGPYPGGPLFPAIEGPAFGGGNAAYQGEALEGEAPSHREGALSIDLPGHPCDPTRAWADHSLDAGPAWYPREVLRGERPKWLFVHFGQSKWTPSGKRLHQAGKPELV